MGWKLSSIIINPKTEIQFENLLEELGFSNLKKIEDEPYDVAIYPEADKVFVGIYKNNLIISANNLPLEFYNKSLSALEEKLINLFPDSEICAVSLNSVINHWGYAIIRDGKKIRARTGDGDSGTTLDIGEPVKEELGLFSKSKLDANGQRKYYFESYSEEPYVESQVGENFVFEIFKRYTGIQLDRDDELLFETNFKGYQASSQVDTVFFDNYFTGVWEGYYMYGDGYRETLKGKKTNFSLTMKVNNGQIQGMSTDEDKQNDKPSIVNGFIISTFINFNLRYQVRYFFDKNDVVQTDTSKSYSIAYTGLFDISNENFRGIWNIENTRCWGEWFMKKKQS